MSRIMLAATRRLALSHLLILLLFTGSGTSLWRTLHNSCTSTQDQVKPRNPCRIATAIKRHPPKHCSGVGGHLLLQDRSNPALQDEVPWAFACILRCSRSGFMIWSCITEQGLGLHLSKLQQTRRRSWYAGIGARTSSSPALQNCKSRGTAMGGLLDCCSRCHAMCASCKGPAKTTSTQTDNVQHPPSPSDQIKLKVLC